MAIVCAVAVPGVSGIHSKRILVETRQRAHRLRAVFGQAAALGQSLRFSEETFILFFDCEVADSVGDGFLAVVAVRTDLQKLE